MPMNRLSPMRPFHIATVAGWFWLLSVHAMAQDPISYSTQIRPILSKNCFACHGPDPDHRESGLALHSASFAFLETDSGDVAIVPGSPDDSLLIERISAGDDEDRMPPAEHGPRLAESEIELIRTWISQGANYEVHWAYQPIRSPAVPVTQNASWGRNPIDAFILQKLEQHGLSPEDEAAPGRLVRRLYLDLIGLPPPPEVVRGFVADPSDERYEAIVDSLLANRHYGEHWARMWLDLARYADSQGYAQDEIREIWKYRDWVIDAFNRDLPFDQFTIEQLAGDMLPEPTEQQMIATAFHRNTMTNTEGGTDDEEFRHAAIVDRTNTTAIVWLGSTMGCAQCHTHKYDPITHKDYYRTFAIFNQTEDSDRPNNAPLLEQYTAEQLADRDRLDAEITGVESKLAGEIGDDEKELLQEELKRLKGERNAIRPEVTPIMRELPPEKQRATHVAVGGAFSNPGDVVNAAICDFGGALPVSLEAEKIATRMDLARWLVADENPLTARVAVNRHWEKIFGIGLVETSEDFGSQGTPPSHPELLDWLAANFRGQGWSMKKLCKTMVMSSTYRQDSRVTAEKRAADPANRLLSRGARYRLTGEQIRDLSLAASGLLSEKMHGPPVRPPQPKTGLNAAFGGSLDWDPSTGEDRYRRGLYTLMRRTNPYPSFMAFDGTNRTTCTVRRIRTNTPVAAFVTLNDPVYVECAQAMARRLESLNVDDDDARIREAFIRVASRRPEPAELQTLRNLLETELEHYQALPDEAQAMACSELGPPDEDKGYDTARLAAWTVVCNVLLNLDETLTRN